MKASIVSLKKILYEGEIVSLNCKTVDGEITILNRHRPLITMLDKGVIKIIDILEKEWYIDVSSGFVEVTPQNHIRILVD